MYPNWQPPPFQPADLIDGQKFRDKIRKDKKDRFFNKIFHDETGAVTLPRDKTNSRILMSVETRNEIEDIAIEFYILDAYYD